MTQYLTSADSNPRSGETQVAAVDTSPAVNYVPAAMSIIDEILLQVTTSPQCQHNSNSSTNNDTSNTISVASNCNIINSNVNDTIIKTGGMANSNNNNNDRNNKNTVTDTTNAQNTVKTQQTSATQIVHTAQTTQITEQSVYVIESIFNQNNQNNQKERPTNGQNDPFSIEDESKTNNNSNNTNNTSNTINNNANNANNRSTKPDTGIYYEEHYYNREEIDRNRRLIHVAPTQADFGDVNVIIRKYYANKLERYHFNDPRQEPFAETLQGHVYDAIDKITKRRVIIKSALKILVHQGLARTGATVREDIRKEREILQFLARDEDADAGFARLVDFWENDEFYILVTEHGGGGFHPYVVNQIKKVKNGEMSIEEWQFRVRYLYRQLARAIYDLHVNRGIAHLDLSFENTVIDEFAESDESDEKNDEKNEKNEKPKEYNPFLRLIDFGLARMSWDGRNVWKYDGFVGKTGYQAPEVRNIKSIQRRVETIPFDSRYDARKADIWSLGVMLFMMATGSPPWGAAERRFGSYTLVMKGKLEELLERWDRDTWVQPEAVDLMKRIFTSAEDRITIREIMEHPYVRDAPRSLINNVELRNIRERINNQNGDWR